MKFGALCSPSMNGLSSEDRLGGRKRHGITELSDNCNGQRKRSRQMPCEAAIQDPSHNHLLIDLSVSSDDEGKTEKDSEENEGPAPSGRIGALSASHGSPPGAAWLSQLRTRLGSVQRIPRHIPRPQSRSFSAGLFALHEVMSPHLPLPGPTGEPIPSPWSASHELPASPIKHEMRPLLRTIGTLGPSRIYGA